jgi:glycerophosphoryl diester phosphodiesterase
MPKNCLIIAHRGESFDAPENTLAAVNLAWERDADAVEIDVQLSKDQKIVVIHDENTKRTGGRRKLVKNQTLKELKELDVGIYKDKKWKGEKIPTLSEILETVPNDKKLIIELKSDHQIINELKDEIHNSNLAIEQVEIISFNILTVTMAKKVMPEHNVLWISELDYSFLRRIFSPSLDKLISDTIKNNLDGLDVWAGNMVDEKFVERIKSEDLMLYVWTVNDPNKAMWLKSIGIDGITTDRAQWIKNKTRIY